MSVLLNTFLVFWNGSVVCLVLLDWGHLRKHKYILNLISIPGMFCSSCAWPSIVSNILLLGARGLINCRNISHQKRLILSQSDCPNYVMMFIWIYTGNLAISWKSCREWQSFPELVVKQHTFSSNLTWFATNDISLFFQHKPLGYFTVEKQQALWSHHYFTPTNSGL